MIEGYTIDKIELENYKRFKSLILLVNGENLAVTGMTDQGKTTVVSTLWELIEMVGEPVTTGETSGRLKITLKDANGSDKKVFAERRFTPSTKLISILDSEGNKIKAKEFKDWFCSLANNPQDLKDKKPTELMELLLECVEFPVRESFEQTETQLALDLEDRKTLKEDLKIMERNLGTQPEEVKLLSIEQATKELTDEQALQTTYATTKQNLESANLKLSDMVTRKAEIVKELEEMEAEYTRLTTWGLTAEKWLAETTVDVEAKQQALITLGTHNEKANAFIKWTADNKAITDQKNLINLRENSVTNLRTMRKKHLESAKWPLPGLCIEDGEVYYNHVPFSQVGDSKKMLICGALAAEQIKDKPLKVVRMDGTESMSKEDFEQLVQLFNTKGIQVLSTRVSRTGETEPGELIIHDGGVL